MKKIALLIGAGFLSWMAVGAAQADILYDNLSAGSAGADAVSSLGPLSDSFSTGASGFTLNNVKFVLDASAPDDGGAVTVNLLADSSTSPGGLLDPLGVILDSQLISSLSVVDVSFAGITLSPNTRYWIQLADANAANGGSISWSWSLDVSGTGVGNEFLANRNGVFANDPNGPYQMQINGVSEIPEPLTLSLLGAGLAGVAAMRRRKKKSA